MSYCEHGSAQPGPCPDCEIAQLREDQELHRQHCLEEAEELHAEIGRLRERIKRYEAFIKDAAEYSDCPQTRVHARRALRNDQ